MYFICLRVLRFPKKIKSYIPAKKKYDWLSSVLGKKRRKKKEAYFGDMGKILKQVSWGFLEV